MAVVFVLYTTLPAKTEVDIYIDEIYNKQKTINMLQNQMNLL